MGNTETTAVHLGDGAYVTRNPDGSLWVTANHHQPEHATDRVLIDAYDVPLLVEFISRTSRASVTESDAGSPST